MKIPSEQKSTCDEIFGTSDSHEELRYPRQGDRREPQDLFALATSLGWSESEKQQLNSIYGSALAFDKRSDALASEKPEMRDKKA